MSPEQVEFSYEKLLRRNCRRFSQAFENAANCRRLVVDPDDRSSKGSIRPKEAMRRLGELGRLTELSIPELGIRELPATIGSLRLLRRLNAEANGLKALPASLWQLEKLKELRLGFNPLKELSRELEQLNSLTVLSVPDCELESLPSCVTGLKLLTRIDAQDNQLRHIPSEIWELPNLQILKLSKTGLKELPSEVRRSGPASIRELELDHNELESLPDWLMTALDDSAAITLDHNRLRALPTRLPRAYPWLDWSHNRFETCPEAFRGGSGLANFDISHNLLSEFPAVANDGVLDLLSEVNLSHNRFTSFPEGVLTYPAIKRVDLSSNQISTVPVENPGFENLKQLILCDNPISEAEQHRIVRRLPNVIISFGPAPE